MTLVESLLALSAVCDGHWPATLAYSEGWLLRVILDWFCKHGSRDHLLTPLQDADWFSEALLTSPFPPRCRGDAHGEGFTHVDGTIGHMRIGFAGKADVRLLPDARQFVCVEAKIGSPLAKGTTHAPDYDQVARTVGCMAETLMQSGCRPESLSSLALLVIAPRDWLSRREREYLEKAHVSRHVRKRARSYGMTDGDWVDKWFEPALHRMVLDSLTWEGLIAHVTGSSPQDGESLAGYYARCLDLAK